MLELPGEGAAKPSVSLMRVERVWDLRVCRLLVQLG
jgi:hypothetical protein